MFSVDFGDALFFTKIKAHSVRISIACSFRRKPGLIAKKTFAVYQLFLSIR